MCFIYYFVFNETSFICPTGAPSETPKTIQRNTKSHCCDWTATERRISTSATSQNQQNHVLRGNGRAHLYGLFFIKCTTVLPPKGQNPATRSCTL